MICLVCDLCEDTLCQYYQPINCVRIKNIVDVFLKKNIWCRNLCENSKEGEIDKNKYV